MSKGLSTEIAVIGAGVVGLAIARQLALEGREVLLIDPADPGSGASYGNAGTIADYAVMPVGSPTVLRNLPSLLFDPNSPLAIRRAALFSLAPWLLRFLRQSLPAATRSNARAIAALTSDAGPRWRDLARGVGGASLLQDRGCLYLFESSADRREADADLGFRRSLGVGSELLDPAGLAALEPGLPPMEGGAAFFPGALFLSDPGRMMAHLAGAVLATGVRHQRSSVTGLARTAGGVRLTGSSVTGAAPVVLADRVVLAAGAHSRALARLAGDRVPLETERGYHLEYDLTPGENSPRLTRPACPTARGFYLCPMTGRLRVAGTVELGGLDPTPSSHRLVRLDQGARAIFPDLPTPSRSWLGFRPSMPDSLPVIGPSCDGAEVIHAYGHGHIGLTLAPVTAALVADLIAGRAPSHDLAPYRVTRF